MGSILTPFGNLLTPGKLQVPTGQLAIDWTHPLANGLSYFRILGANIAPPVYTRASDGGMLPQASAVIGMAALGPALTVGAYYPSTNTSSLFSMPQNTGTVSFLVQASFSPTDGVYHGLFACGKSSVVGDVDIVKFSDNNWYSGWQQPADNRVVTAASGTFSAGDVFMVTSSWNGTGNASTQTGKFYTKGILRNSNSKTQNTADTSSQDFLIGDDINRGGNLWCRANGTAIYSVAIWDRQLSDQEVQQYSLEPWSFMIPAEYEMPIMKTPAAGFTPVFRKTLSQIGGRIGTRQPQGWAA